MKAVKNNKVYTVTELTKKEYLAQGYDIVDGDGNVIERSPSSAVPYSEYAKLLAEIEQLKAQEKSKK